MKIAVWATLRSTDAGALIDFLCTAFGFEEVFVVSSEDGKRLSSPQLGEVDEDYIGFYYGMFGGV